MPSRIETPEISLDAGVHVQQLLNVDLAQVRKIGERTERMGLVNASCQRNSIDVEGATKHHSSRSRGTCSVKEHSRPDEIRFLGIARWRGLRTGARLRSQQVNRLKRTVRERSVQRLLGRNAAAYQAEIGMLPQSGKRIRSSTEVIFETDD